jgi:transposase
MGEAIYVGVDVSKKALDIAVVVADNEGDKRVRATKRISNDMAGGYKHMEQWVRGQMHKARCTRMHYVVESTGIYGEAVIEYLAHRAETEVSVINPAGARSFSKTLGLRTKTDKVDAKVLGLYGATLKPQAMVRMSKELKELRTLERYLEYLTDRRAQEKVRLESASNPVVRGSIQTEGHREL